MVNAPGSYVQPLLICLEDGSSPPEDKTNAYLRLAEDLATEDKQFVEEVSNYSSRLMSVLTRDIFSKRVDLSQAALQAVGYCIYQDRIISSLSEPEMSLVLQDLCNVVMRSTDKNCCTRALWGISKQHLPINVVIEKKIPFSFYFTTGMWVRHLPSDNYPRTTLSHLSLSALLESFMFLQKNANLLLLLNTVEHALQTFDSTTVENEALEVINRLISELPSENITSTAGRWSKLVYPLLISSAHKIREKAIGILELGLKHIVVARQDVVVQLLPDLKEGVLSELAKLFTEKKQIFVLRAWIVIVAILGETLHKGGNFINEMLKFPEQAFKSLIPDVQNMAYTAWISLIDNFATSPAYIGSQKRLKLLMMPLLLKSGTMTHQDIELGRIKAWWHLVCAIESKTYASTAAFSEVCVPLLQYFFEVSLDLTETPNGNSKDGMRELVLPVTPVSRSQTTSRRSSLSSRKKTVVLNQAKLPEAFVQKAMIIGFEMLVEILAIDTNEVRKNKHLTEHLQNPILNNTLFQEHSSFFLAVVKSALYKCASFISNDDLAVSLWSNIVNWTVTLIQNGNPGSFDNVIASFFLTANDILTCSTSSSSLNLKFLEVLTKIPVKYLVHSVEPLLPLCNQGKPIFLLTEVLFRQMSTFKKSYVDERFHVVFENLIDVGFEAPSAKLTTVYNIWLVLDGLASTVANVEDLWRFWSKVTDSVTECVTKTSHVNQGDTFDPDFSLMISLLSFPFKELFSGGLPLVTAKELDRDLAEFFRMFCRCASLVPGTEANMCIEELARPLVTAVTYEKCKNVRFLDSISGFLLVMMDCVDFSSQNARTSPPYTNLTPKGRSRGSENPLGNLKSLVALSAKALSNAYKVDTESRGSVVVGPSVTVLAGSISKLFASLTNTQQIALSIAALSSSVSSFIKHHQWSSSFTDTRSSDKKCNNNKYLLKIEKVWTDILMCLQSRYTASFDSRLLQIVSELLECTLSHHRRQFKHQTIMFWNATFGQADYLEYPDSLRTVLQTVTEKTPLILPGWDVTKIKIVPVLDDAAMIQDSEEMTPKENIIQQVPLANASKRKHGGSSPGKVKGSFLNKAFGSDKNDSLSPFENTLEAGNKRKSPGSANARRKLPLPLDTDDDTDFVVIAPSPKKKRLLTEHQKEVKKAKKLESGYPVLYNMLDQSQDGTQFSELSQSSVSQSFNHRDEKMSDEKFELKGGTNGHFAAVSTVLTNQLDSGSEREPSEYTHDHLSIPNLTLPNVTERRIGDSSELCEQLDNDDEPIPSSQNTAGISSKQKRRSRIYRTPKNKKFREESKVVEKTDGDKVELCTRNLVDSVCMTDNKNRSNVEDSSGVIDSTETENAKKAISPESSVNIKASKLTSPISSRTRFRKNPTPYKPQNSKHAKIIASLRQQEATEMCLPDVLTDYGEYSDHQMDDTLIIEDNIVCNQSSNNEVNHTKNSENNELEDTLNNEIKSGCSFINNELKDTSRSASNDVEDTASNDVEDTAKSSKSQLQYKPGRNMEINENVEMKVTSNSTSDEIKDKKLLNEEPSSPVPMKFVQSKTSATGSPLSRPHFSVASPACSPTTGILKRNRGRSETPSPPGKTRHVSFAFPLQEEKEINFWPLDEVGQINRNELGKLSAEVNSTFTCIKATPMTTTPPSNEECVFPELVECTTPVEQILPSLAASRFSRGLGHVVHAQNIKTVGNLSALSKDQIEKLPIRSPKVSTLRRVLRNFSENRAPKSPKFNQLRVIEEMSEESDKEDKIVKKIAEIADNQTKLNDTEELVPENNSPELKNKNPAVTVATPSSSVSIFGKMQTPRRSRALVKPTTLFESDSEKRDVDENKIAELSVNIDVISESGNTEGENQSTETPENRENSSENKNILAEAKQDYASNNFVNKDETPHQPAFYSVGESIAVTSSALTDNNSTEIVREDKASSEHPTNKPCVADVKNAASHATIDTKVERKASASMTANIEIRANKDFHAKEPTLEDEEMQSQVFPAADHLKRDSQDIVVDDVLVIDPSKQESDDECDPHAKRKIILAGDVPMSEELKQKRLTEEGKAQTLATEPEKLEILVTDVSGEWEKEKKKTSLERSVEEIGTVDLYVKTLNSLLSFKLQQDLGKLPLEILLQTQEQLMALLSKTTAAIRLKCEDNK